MIPRIYDHDQILEAQIDRSNLWHADDTTVWNIADWGCAFGGEAGELSEEMIAEGFPGRDYNEFAAWWCDSHHVAEGVWPVWCRRIKWRCLDEGEVTG